MSVISDKLSFFERRHHKSSLPLITLLFLTFLLRPCVKKTHIFDQWLPCPQFWSSSALLIEPWYKSHGHFISANLLESFKLFFKTLQPDNIKGRNSIKVLPIYPDAYTSTLKNLLSYRTVTDLAKICFTPLLRRTQGLQGCQKIHNFFYK